MKRDLHVLWNLDLAVRKRKEREGDQPDVILWSVNEENDLINLLSNGSVRQDIENVLDNTSSEDSTAFQTIFEEVQAPEEEVEAILEQMLDNGEIFESKPGRVKPM